MGLRVGPSLYMPLSFTVMIFTGGGVRGTGPDLCHGLEERIGYNYQMQKWVEKNAPHAFCTALAFRVSFYYPL